jgi:hypothetical protein
MTSKKPASEDDGPDSKEKLDKVVGKYIVALLIIHRSD